MRIQLVAKHHQDALDVVVIYQSTIQYFRILLTVTSCARVAELFWPQHELALDMVNAFPSLLTSGFSAPQLAAKGPKIPVLSSRAQNRCNSGGHGWSRSQCRSSEHSHVLTVSLLTGPFGPFEISKHVLFGHKAKFQAPLFPASESFS